MRPTSRTVSLAGSVTRRLQIPPAARAQAVMAGTAALRVPILTSATSTGVAEDGETSWAVGWMVGATGASSGRLLPLGPGRPLPPGVGRFLPPLGESALLRGSGAVVEHSPGPAPPGSRQPGSSGLSLSPGTQPPEMPSRSRLSSDEVPGPPPPGSTPPVGPSSGRARPTRLLRGTVTLTLMRMPSGRGRCPVAEGVHHWLVDPTRPLKALRSPSRGTPSGSSRPGEGDSRGTEDESTEPGSLKPPPQIPSSPLAPMPLPQMPPPRLYPP